jgi:hypothetical protein
MLLLKLFKKLSNFYKKIFFNYELVDLLKMFNETDVIKSLIYNHIDKYMRISIRVRCNNDAYIYLTCEETIIKSFNEIKYELDYKNLANLLVNNKLLEENEILLDIYYIYGYLVLNNYNINNIKNYNEDQIKIFIKEIYTEIIYCLINSLYLKIMKLINIEDINDIDNKYNIDEIINKIKVNIIKSKSKYKEINLIN